ncbi:MAG: helix-turn-helix domain-containing protein [Gammaproteobacteria bacterium]|nr:helix-turn-helix domain-containing protein [Gammaproteobacteria bacterium]
MTVVSTLLNEIIELARRKGMKQKDLAAQAGLSAEMLSRAKKSGDMHLSSLIRLADTVGMTLQLVTDDPVLNKISNGTLFN